jgi:hypothetical protein
LREEEMKRFRKARAQACAESWGLLPHKNAHKAGTK